MPPFGCSHFHTLPPEIIIHISSFAGTKALMALARTQKSLYSNYRAVAIEQEMRHGRGKLLEWAFTHDHPETLWIALSMQMPGLMPSKAAVTEKVISVITNNFRDNAVDMLKVLLSIGANIHEIPRPSEEGGTYYTANELFCMADRPAMLGFLLAICGHKKINEPKCDWGLKETVIRHFAKGDYPESVQILLDAGADPNEAIVFMARGNEIYSSPLETAISTDKWDIVGLLRAVGVTEPDGRLTLPTLVPRWWNRKDFEGVHDLLAFLKVSEPYGFHVDQECSRTGRSLLSASLDDGVTLSRFETICEKSKDLSRVLTASFKDSIPGKARGYRALEVLLITPFCWYCGKEWEQKLRKLRSDKIKKILREQTNKEKSLADAYPTLISWIARKVPTCHLDWVFEALDPYLVVLRKDPKAIKEWRRRGLETNKLDAEDGKRTSRLISRIIRKLLKAGF